MKLKYFFSLCFFVTINILIKAQTPALVGYWHNWYDAAAPYIPLDQVDSRYNIVCVSFGIPQTGTNAQIVFTPDQTSQATLITQIRTLQNQGKQVILSLGGATAPISMNNASDKAAFISSVSNLVNTYGFDGIDIDFEGSSVSVSGGTIANPIDQPILNLIAGIKQIMVNYRTTKSRKMFLSMAPETAFVQGGMSSYGGIWGAYLPVIHALRDSMDILQVQLYNSGTMYGIDGRIYGQGTADFIVSQTEAVIKGFNTNGGAFVGLPAHKIAVGLPACSSAASGFATTATVKAAINYLRGTGAKPGTYTLAQAGGYPDLRGMMTWSINWDKMSNCGATYEFAQNFQSIFSGVVSNLPPSVSITSPSNNATFVAPASITLNATATDADGTIAKVEFYNGTTLLNTDNTAPYTFTWSNVVAGTYNVTAKAYDNAGAVTVSSITKVVVNATNSPPSVSITSPTPNAVFAFPSTVTITANAKDADGTIAKVEFYRGTTLLNTDNAAPYAYSWANVPLGTYSLTAKAYDNLGAVTSSTAVSFVVKKKNIAPTVSLTSPINNSSFLAPANITINATATDADGTIKKVDFYNGTVLLNSDNVAPYSFVWSNVAAGTYSLTAKATDNSGVQTVSAAIQVVVKTVSTTADLIGANCASPNNVLVYELNVANIPNITSTSWWCSGSVASIVPVTGQPWKATFDFGSWFAGGNVCVGVNYSGSPWYKSFCKTVSLCPRPTQSTIPPKTGLVGSVPTVDVFNFIVPKNIKEAKVFDQLGIEKINLGILQSDETISFGEQLPSGAYFLTILYEDNTREVIKLMKAK